MRKGRLKIFFGYAAGVGKTYAMLENARELRDNGLDVIIGYLEPHARPETIKMAETLEVLPLKEFEYKGIKLKEFDVDAAIKRKPKLMIVDELAHTNAPGSKNRKRYLDVEELINNGIDVFTTINVQHIEGLHDRVDSVTSVDVNERIPDEIFDYADEVVLIDIEPKVLIDRMKEGKIYQKTHATVALEHFFKSDNLSMLRELFMRRSADRIEKQMNNGELKIKVLVLISPSPSSQKNIRIAARTAEAYHCSFSAMYVETSGSLSDESAANIKKHMKLVRDMGGELIVKYSNDLIGTVSDYIKLAGVTNLIMGKSWQSVGRKIGLEDSFVARFPNIELLIVPDNQNCFTPKSSLKNFFMRFFNQKKLLQKYKISNKILDISNLMTRSVISEDSKPAEMKIAEILSRAFERSTALYHHQNLFIVSWNDEDIRFYDEPNEQAVLKWCLKNGKVAGKGSDTLREASAIYFPLVLRKETIIVSFSCINSKMSITDKLIFNQLQELIKALLSSK